MPGLAPEYPKNGQYFCRANGSLYLLNPATLSPVNSQRISASPVRVRAKKRYLN
jgi:hypothetical protein